MPVTESRTKPPATPAGRATLYWYAFNTSTQCYEQRSTTLLWDELDQYACGQGTEMVYHFREGSFDLFKIYSKEERYAFMCAGDAKNMTVFAQTNRVFISVRNTGLQTITRLSEGGAGYACKPHEILDKTIKPKTVNQARKDINEIIQNLKRTGSEFSVFFKSSPQDLSGQGWWKTTTFSDLTNIVLDGSNGVLPSGNEAAFRIALMRFNENILGFIDSDHPAIGFVGWWVDLQIKGLRGGPSYSLKIPIGILRVGLTKSTFQHSRAIIEAEYEKGVGVSFDSLKTAIPVDAYTGDYDLHGIFDIPLAPTKSTTTATGSSSMGRVGEVLALLNANGSLFYRKRQVSVNGKNIFTDTDSYRYLFQHGQQGSYDTHVLRHNYDLPYLKDQLLQLQGQPSNYHPEIPVASLLVPDATGVLAFGPNNDVHIMSSLPEMLAFYRLNGLDINPFTMGNPTQLEVVASLWPNVDRLLKVEAPGTNIACYTNGMLASPDQPMLILKNDFQVKTIASEVIPEAYQSLFYQAYVEKSKTVTGRLEKKQAFASTNLYPPCLSIFCAALAFGNTFQSATLSGTTRLVSLLGPMNGDLSTFQKNYGVANYTLTAIPNGVQCTSTVAGNGEKQRITGEKQQITWEFTLYPPMLSIFSAAVAAGNRFINATLSGTGTTRLVSLLGPMNGDLSTFQKNYGVANYTLTAIPNGVQCTSTVAGNGEKQQITWQFTFYPPMLSIFSAALAAGNRFINATLDTNANLWSVSLTGRMNMTLNAFQNRYSESSYPLSAIPNVPNGIRCTSLVAGNMQTQQITWQAAP